MSRIRRLRPTPATVIACLALTFALGGTSYAAVSKLLPTNSVGTKQVVNHSLLAEDFHAGVLLKGDTGAAGPAGPAGPAGAAGAAADPVLWAFVDGSDGTTYGGNSVSATSRTGTGTYK